MATFLELCQAVARESGTVPTIGDPQTVVNQTGRLARVVYWTQAAWNAIQRESPNWRWMQADFSGSTVAGVQFYDAAAMGITRFRAWHHRAEGVGNYFTLYDPDIGQADEGRLSILDYEDFRMTCMIGEAATMQGKPSWLTVAPDDTLGLHKTPDKAYTLRGRYTKSQQVLVLDSDVPEMPADFHDAITWRALILMGTYDEATQQMPTWAFEYSTIMDELRRSQLPRIDVGGPLA